MYKLLKPNQLIEVNFNSKSAKHYRDLGYDYQKGKSIYVLPEHLCLSSKAQVVVLCDNCGKPCGKNGTIAWGNYIKTHDKHFGDLCSECKWIKTKNTNLQKYGTEQILQSSIIRERINNTFQKKYGGNPMLNENVKEKIQKTNLERYGVKSVSQNPNIYNKINKTNLEKYGYKSPMQNQMVKDKAKETIREKYGVDSPMQNQEIRNKAQNTNIEKYGVPCYLMLPFAKEKAHSLEAIEKANKTMQINGSCKTSKQQKELNEMLKDIYKESEMNVACSKFSLDCVINVNGCKIDVEYDGWYWHKDIRKDLIRDRIVQREGYKVLRIKSGNLLPTKEQIINAVNLLIKEDKKFTQIILSDWGE